ncbi:MAG: molybdopterin oxidoreductase family protein, partial [Polyangiaceae bacterium]|nr:molybdopterin oxidoreductase family protein [Polyangiaceae bacterium]
HNAERLVRGRERCILLMSPVDAERAGIRSGTRVEVRSRVGSLEVGVELSDEMMPGVVSLPHGFGHGLRGVQLRVAQVRPGVSANDVTDDARYDAVSGTSALNGVPVTVRPV